MIRNTLFKKLLLSFFVVVMIGTLVHESGHYYASRYLGYNARITYRSSPYTLKGEFKQLFDTIYRIKNPGKKEVDKIDVALRRYKKDQIIISSAGPITNMLIGMTGFVMLLLSTKLVKLYQLRWIFVFMTLFWSRQILNFIVFAAEWVFTPQKLLQSRGDELYVSLLLNLPYYTLNVLTFILALPFVCIAIFRFVKKDELITFFAAGIIGGGIGVLAWFFWIGPWLLP